MPGLGFREPLGFGSGMLAWGTKIAEGSLGFFAT